MYFNIVNRLKKVFIYSYCKYIAMSQVLFLKIYAFLCKDEYAKISNEIEPLKQLMRERKQRL